MSSLLTPSPVPHLCLCSCWTSWMYWMILCWATCPQRSSLFYTHTYSPVLWTTGTRAVGVWGCRVRASLRWKELLQPHLPLRPLYLPVRVLITAETFTLSSNIVMDTSTFLLRYAGYPRPGPSTPRWKVLTSCCLSAQGLLDPSICIWSDGVPYSHMSGMWIVCSSTQNPI